MKISTGKTINYAAVVFSVLLSFEAVVFAENIVIEPYLQNVTTSSIIVRWQTDTAVTGSVNYSEDLNYSSTATEESDQTFHQVPLTGLSAGKSYNYKITVNLVEYKGSFKTAPQGDTPFSFMVWGDSQTNPGLFNSVIKEALKKPLDIALSVGDIVQEAPTTNSYKDQLFDPAKDMLKNISFFNAIGNHEYSGDSTAANFKTLFNGAGTGKMYYAFTYGNSRFVICNSNDVSLTSVTGVQYNWLVAEFASPEYQAAKHRFLLLHHSPYSWDWYGGEVSIQNMIAPLAEDNNIDIFFSGHFHCYNRGKKTKNGHETYYVVTGGCGGFTKPAYYPPGYNDWPFMSVHEWKYHSSYLQVNFREVALTAIDMYGNTFDSFKIGVNDPPVVSTVLPLSGSNLISTTLTILGSGFFGNTGSGTGLSITINGIPVDTSGAVISETSIFGAVVPGGIASGTYDVVVTTGVASNASSAQKFTVTTPAPAVTELKPATGSNLSAVNITITGSGFYGGLLSSTVSNVALDDGVNTQLTGITAISDSEIRAVVPAGVMIGNYNLRVSAAGGTSLTTGTAKFTVTTPAPAVTGLNPIASSNLEVTAITISGTGFYSGLASSTVSRVSLDDFGNTALTGVTAVSSNEIHASVPAGLIIGNYNVQVTTTAGTNVTSTVRFSVTTPEPKITEISPSTGSNFVPTTVSLTGSGFFGGVGANTVTSVKLSDGTNLSGYTVVSDSKITGIIVPAGVPVGLYDIRVSATGGTNSTSSTKFTVTCPSSAIDNSKDYTLNVPLHGEGLSLNISIPAGAFGENLTLTVSSLPVVPDSGQKNLLVTQVGVELTLSNLSKTSTKSITLRFQYDDSNLSGFDENRLVVGYYDEIQGRWIVLKTIRDSAGNILLAVTTHFSKYAILQLVPSANLDNVLVYPNPFRPGSGGSYDAGGITFGGLSSGAKIQILSVSGGLVRELEETDNDGIFLWDAKNSSGDKAASGVYLYLITDPAGNKKTGKFAVIR